MVFVLSSGAFGLNVSGDHPVLGTRKCRALLLCCTLSNHLSYSTVCWFKLCISVEMRSMCQVGSCSSLSVYEVAVQYNCVCASLLMRVLPHSV